MIPARYHSVIRLLGFVDIHMSERLGMQRIQISNRCRRSEERYARSVEFSEISNNFRPKAIVMGSSWGADMAAEAISLNPKPQTLNPKPRISDASSLAWAMAAAVSCA